MPVTEQEMGILLSIVSRADNTQIKRLYEAAKSRQVVLNNQTIRQIRVGAKVKWNGKHGPNSGTVLRVKQKYVEVREDKPTGPHGIPMTWNVPAAMLTVVDSGVTIKEV